MAEAFTRGREVSLTLRAISEGFEEAQEALGNLREHIRSVVGEQVDFTQGQVRMTLTQKSGSDAIQHAVSQTVDLGKTTKELSGIMDLAQQKGAGLMESMFGVTEGMSGAAKGASIAAVAFQYLFKVAMASAQVASDLEFQLARVQIVGEDVARGLVMDMREMEASVLDSMRNSIFQMRDITDVMYKFAAAGKFTSEEITEATQSIVDLGMATGYIENLGKVAENTAAIMNIYGNQVEGVSEVTDVMAKVANDSVMSIEDIGTSMQYVGPIGVMAGQQFEQIAAALTILSNQGLAASQAGRYLRQVFTYLADRTPEAERAMRKLGVQVTDSQGNFRDLSDIVSDLTLALEGMTEVEQVKLMTQAFGVWGAQAMSAMVNAEREAMDATEAHSRSLKEVTEDIYEEGYASQRAEKLLQTYQGRKIQLTNTVKTLGVALGTKMLPPLTKIMETFIEITQLESFQRFIENMATVFGNLAEAIERTVGLLLKFFEVVEKYTQYIEEEPKERRYMRGVITAEEAGQLFEVMPGKAPPGLGGPKIGGGEAPAKTAGIMVTNMNTINIRSTSPRGADASMIGQSLAREMRYKKL